MFAWVRNDLERFESRFVSSAEGEGPVREEAGEEEEEEMESNEELRHEEGKEKNRLIVVVEGSERFLIRRV